MLQDKMEISSTVLIWWYILQDCDGDGAVNCLDYAAIHRLGGYGCSGALDYNYQNKFMNCQRQVQQLTGRK